MYDSRNLSLTFYLVYVLTTGREIESGEGEISSSIERERGMEWQVS